MDKYTIDEIQYKNGYAKGYEDGKKDAVEVVRCKDCRQWFADNACHTYVNGELHPMGCCQNTRRFTADCDFCSYGERKK